MHDSEWWTEPEQPKPRGDFQPVLQQRWCCFDGHSSVPSCFPPHPRSRGWRQSTGQTDRRISRPVQHWSWVRRRRSEQWYRLGLKQSFPHWQKITQLELGETHQRRWWNERLERTRMLVKQTRERKKAFFPNLCDKRRRQHRSEQRNGETKHHDC